MKSDSVVAIWIHKKEDSLALNLLSILFGVFFLSILAQVAIPLPWTPVPITGQTFAVLLVSLLWGLKRSSIIMVLYLTVGALGAPVFSLGSTGLVWGPTIGYLAGMLFSSLLMGYLSDIGFTKNIVGVFTAAILGEILIFGFGLFVLSFFVPVKNLLTFGLFPFLPGEVLKLLLAAYLVVFLRTKLL